jgi:hypothetical protein
MFSVVLETESKYSSVQCGHIAERQLLYGTFRASPFVVLVRAAGRWMNEWSNGGMILTGETGVLGEKHYTASVVDE